MPRGRPKKAAAAKEPEAATADPPAEEEAPSAKALENPPQEVSPERIAAMLRANPDLIPKELRRDNRLDGVLPLVRKSVTYFEGLGDQIEENLGDLRRLASLLRSSPVSIKD